MCFLILSVWLIKYLEILTIMGLFKRSNENSSKDTKCKECGTELHDPERLQRHIKKAHGNVPAKKLDPSSGGGTW